MGACCRAPRSEGVIMHEIVIRGGTIVDGTGAAPFTGDIAVDGGKITAVGGKAGPGRRMIDADGLLVTPGWVDVHTHYDGQATWDPILAPSSWHRATDIHFVACGVGFVLVRPYHRDALIDLMEGVEDTPGPVPAVCLLVTPGWVDVHTHYDGQATWDPILAP